MSARGPSATGWCRGLLIVFAVAGPVALSFSYFDRADRLPAKAASQDTRPVEIVSDRPQVATIVAPGALRVDAAPSSDNVRRTAVSGYFTRPEFRKSPSVPFKFLGKITDGDETVVLLYRDGQTLTVRGIGPIDDDYDDYVVDAFEAASLVLRRVADGETQIIQLMSLAPMVETGGSAENTPQD